MSLHIMDPRAGALANELAALTGESVEEAVILALRERLRAEGRMRGVEGKAARMLQMAGKFAEGMKPGCRSEDHASLLYGEDSLPQ